MQNSSLQSHHPRYFVPDTAAVYRSRYKFIAKVGTGQHSTVWVCKDVAGHFQPPLVAVKALTDQATAWQGTYSFERQVLENVRSHLDTGHPGSNHVPRLLDDFTEGGHLFLVTDMLGATLKLVQNRVEDGRLPLPLVKSIARQVLQALDFLHTTCGVVHTDIKQDNIQFVFQNTKSIPGDVAKILATASGDVKLIDFGTAMPAGGPRNLFLQADALRAPEVLIGCPWDYAIDIWNLGCIIFELLTGDLLFSLPPSDGQISREQAHFAQIISMLPDNRVDSRMKSFWQTGTRWPTVWDLQRNGPFLKVNEASPLTTTLARYGLQDPTLLGFLEAMLKLHPRDRQSARSLLQHPWLA